MLAKQLFERIIIIMKLPGAVDGDAHRPWQADRNCRNDDRDLFLARTTEDEAAAKAICAECPVQAECAISAIANGYEGMIFGGLNDAERAQFRGVVVVALAEFKQS